MKVLFIGDVFGKAGREVLRESLPEIFKSEKPDFTVANAENSAGGKGLTQKVADELFAAGCDALTLGDHAWDRKEILEIIDDERIVRPLNFPPGCPGHGRTSLERDGQKLTVVSLMGRTFIERPLDCPFQTIGREKFDGAAIVDFHAEATSEKIAMKWFLAGKVSAIIGTHTHIPTDDMEIVDGTAYMTDCGMTGPFDSVIGVDKNIILKRFLTGFPARFEAAMGDARLNAVLVEIDAGRATGIKKIRVKKAEM
ncbi:MAG: TIGR00282 family metallophosphoesterase [Elusimicrobia bacterium CG08_land_8_20_14_0_20_44_26]|nr:MAG: TIGR00282 family metallophosphoesterase [Elusimicrobia bacterium CG08_land_8_20_14_0_20_44_26]